MRQHINNKIIYSVYFMCDMFQYKFNFESFFLISGKKYPYLDRFFLYNTWTNVFSFNLLFQNRSEGLKSAATSRRLGNRTAVAILLLLIFYRGIAKSGFQFYPKLT